MGRGNAVAFEATVHFRKRVVLVQKPDSGLAALGGYINGSPCSECQTVTQELLVARPSSPLPLYKENTAMNG